MVKRNGMTSKAPIRPEDAGPPVDGWQRRRDAISRNIEEAALRLFDRHGADNVTVAQICADAGISQRTFFRYFASRDDTLGALPRRRVERIAHCLRARPQDERLLDALQAGIHVALAMDEQERRVATLWVKVARYLVQEGRPIRNNGRYAGTVIAEAIQQRAIREGMAPEMIGPYAGSISGVLQFTYRRWLAEEPPRDLELVWDDTFRHFLAATRLP